MKMEGKTWVTYFKKDFNCVGLYHIKCCEICIFYISQDLVFSVFTNSFLSSDDTRLNRFQI